MRNGKPRTPPSPTSTPRRATPSPINTSKAKTGIQKKKPDPTKPRTQHKQGLLSVLLADPRLTITDKKAISQAHVGGVTIADLAALTVYEIRLAQAFYAIGELAAKDLVVAIGKAASHVAAAAQLGQEHAPQGAAISITFEGDGPTSARRDGPTSTPPNAQVGDIIDAE